MNIKDFIVQVALPEHRVFAQEICDEMAESAKVRGTGIAKRTPEYVSAKITEGKSVIAFHKDGTWAGFCYVETWSHGQFVANSGLIVNPNFRKVGLAKAIKQEIFKLSRKLYPEAKLFGLTTGLAVMKINSELGYEPVTYSELTQDEEFWKGCQSCVNFDILQAKKRVNCMCTAMLYDPKDKERGEAENFKIELEENPKVYERFMKQKMYKMFRFLKNFGGKTLKSALLILN